MNMKVETLAKNLITPSSPTPTHLQNLKISCLDQIAIPFHAVFIFYYRASTSDQNSGRSEQLKKSLSETLTLFYPLAGRYNKYNLSIDCNDKGVEFVEAHVNVSLFQFLKGVELDTQLLTQLAPPQVQPDDSPLVIIHFNMFECGGSAITVGMSHRVIDGFSFVTFLNAWATTSRIGVEKVPCPSFQLSSLCPPRDDHMPSSLQISIPAGKLEGSTSKILMERFVFSDTKISKLKVAAASASTSDGSKLLMKHKPTRVEVLMALIWSTIIKVARASHGRLRPSIMTFPINMRGKTAIQVPEYSIGNFAATSIARFTVPEDESSKKVEIFHDLVGRIQEAKANTIADCAKATSADELFAIVKNATDQVNEILGKGESDVYINNSWCRFPVYEADFGFGKPAWFCSSYIKVDLIGRLLDTKDGDGIEVWVSLDENKMLRFRQDPDIIEYSS